MDSPLGTFSISSSRAAISFPFRAKGSAHGEGYVRLSTFTTAEHAAEALRRIKEI